VSIDRTRLKSILEALIFVSEEPASLRKMQAVLEGIGTVELKAALGELMAEWAERNTGIEMVEVAEGFQFRTRPENSEWVRMLVKYKPQRLSKPSMETLAIIAYNQPATKADIEAIRGVDCSSPVSQLLEKGLIKILGRKEVPGKPFIYGTTKAFLEVMGLKDLEGLPTLKEIEGAEIFLPDDDEEPDEDDESDEGSEEETSESETTGDEVQAESAEENAGEDNRSEQSENDQDEPDDFDDSDEDESVDHESDDEEGEDDEEGDQDDEDDPDEFDDSDGDADDEDGDESEDESDDDEVDEDDPDEDEVDEDDPDEDEPED
jgi:segregation and condensation protein B